MTRPRPNSHPDTIEVPAKLAALVRIVDIGNPNRRVLAFDEELVAVRPPVNRRHELSARVQTVNRLHRLLTEFIPSTVTVRGVARYRASTDSRVADSSGILR